MGGAMQRMTPPRGMVPLGPQGPPGGGGPPGTPIMPSPADSTNSGENIYTMINTVPPGGNRQNVGELKIFTHASQFTMSCSCSFCIY
ncbi:hypothetical protein cypCar_00028432 [Cyprinus carpio]|nr:hypothetical protein cypCar_00028432 [Cyprinus carpio]